MRDETIRHLHNSNTRRSMMLLRQFEFLNTRQLAFEHVLSNRWSILKAIWNPQWMKREVDLRQQDYLAECRKAMEQAQQSRKPSIIKVNG